ncbi:MAG TPA: hypothetical protein VHW69_15245 [Rhizomicrobium sp.]|nr:hypothetical protein [Rhizomicrobium sp.]
MKILLTSLCAFGVLAWGALVIMNASIIARLHSYGTYPIQNDIEFMAAPAAGIILCTGITFLLWRSRRPKMAIGIAALSLAGALLVAYIENVSSLG